jgi:hypothetical protein
LRQMRESGMRDRREYLEIGEMFSESRVWSDLAF